jgi:hypothetical protein
MEGVQHCYLTATEKNNQTMDLNAAEMNRHIVRWSFFSCKLKGLSQTVSAKKKEQYRISMSINTTASSNRHFFY